jgi:predicted metal-dependent hydrolase
VTRLTPEDFKQEVSEWADRIDVDPSEIHLREMKRKWGSCSTNGRLTFSTELLSEPVDVRSRVIVHELLHLKIPNHGPLFRRLEGAYLAQTKG